MGKLTIGGEPAKATARKRPAPDSTPKPFVDPAWGVVNADPFHVDTDMDPALRASWLADAGIWQSQWLDELSTLARKAHRLDTKLRCIPDDPHRPAAVQKSLHMEADIIQRVRDLIMAEGQADAVWQSLTPKQRGSHNADFMWSTPADEDRLIGATWFRLATPFEWPEGWRLNRAWFAGLPLSVVVNLRTYRVLAWNPRPPPPSIFTDHRNDPIPDDLKDELLKGQKH